MKYCEATILRGMNKNKTCNCKAKYGIYCYKHKHYNTIIKSVLNKEIEKKVKKNKLYTIEQCAICLEKFDSNFYKLHTCDNSRENFIKNHEKLNSSITTLKCGHFFHLYCISKHGIVSNNLEKQCPICRSSFKFPNELENMRKENLELSDRNEYICDELDRLQTDNNQLYNCNIYLYNLYNFYQNLHKQFHEQHQW